jgi:hypothetical protein
MKKLLIISFFLTCLLFSSSLLIPIKGYSWGISRKGGGPENKWYTYVFALHPFDWGLMLAEGVSLSHHGADTHEGFIYTGYNNARAKYMSEGNTDPCWKVSSNHCANVWLTPALVNMSMSILCAVYAGLANTIPSPIAVTLGGPPAVPAWISSSVMFFGLWVMLMEPIGRVDWLMSAQITVDTAFASKSKATETQDNPTAIEAWHFDMSNDDYNSGNADGSFNNQKNYNQLMRYVKTYAKKIRSFWIANENVEDFHLRRWLDDDSLGAHLHAIADFSAHSKFFSFLYLKGRTENFDGTLPENVGVIRIMNEALKGTPGYVDFYNNHKQYMFASGNHNADHSHSNYDYDHSGTISTEEENLSRAGEQQTGEAKAYALRMAYQDCEDFIYARLKDPIPFTD